MTLDKHLIKSPFILFSAPKKGNPDVKSGYANNFGQPHGGAANVESQLIVTLLKPLVSKFTENSKELHNQEHIVRTTLHNTSSSSAVLVEIFIFKYSVFDTVWGFQ